MCYRAALGVCLSMVLSSAVLAQDLPKTTLKVIGLNSPNAGLDLR